MKFLRAYFLANNNLHYLRYINLLLICILVLIYLEIICLGIIICKITNRFLDTLGAAMHKSQICVKTVLVCLAAFLQLYSNIDIVPWHRGFEASLAKLCTNTTAPSRRAHPIEVGAQLVYLCVAGSRRSVLLGFEVKSLFTLRVLFGDALPSVCKKRAVTSGWFHGLENKEKNTRFGFDSGIHADYSGFSIARDQVCQPNKPYDGLSADPCFNVICRASL